jgi:CubicO group peptidase (beta-lactamase class C family)
MPRILIAIFLLLQSTTFAQTTLPRSTPEAEGVSSAGIIKYLDAIAKSKHEMHSFMLLRHGKVIAEGWWNPYRADLRHTMYSCSKSFTATAVGFAINEGKLKLEDKVTSFFPDKLPDTVKPWLAKLTVQDVLMMSDGMKPDPSSVIAGLTTDWTKGFLNTPIVEEPGTTFLYNSAGTYMLSAIVQKVTGQKVVDYLKPRLFDPLGISGMDWEENLIGVNTGGWGLRIKTEDMAKFAQLFLQKGKWNGQTVLPESWVADATTSHIMQDPQASQSKKDSSDWLQGYCYQMWRCRHNAYRGDGAFGQYMLVMPELDAVMAITSESADLQGELNLVWDYILPAIKNEKLKEDKASLAKLQERIKALALPLPENKPTLASMQTIHAKTFEAAPNASHIKGYVFQFDQGVCHFTLQTDTANYTIDLGGAQWKESMTAKPQQTLTSLGRENLAYLYPAKVTGSYGWRDDKTMDVVLRYIESPHSEHFVFTFEGNKLTADWSRSFDFGKLKQTVTATAK